MRRLLFSVLAFSVMGLAGPVLRLLTWPPGNFEAATSTSASRFVYQLVFLLWPTQMLAAREVSAGRVMAVGYAVVANVLIFCAAGVIVGLLAGRSRIVALLYALAVVAVILWALTGAGFDYHYLHWLPLMTALGLYAVPFVIAQRAGA